MGLVKRGGRCQGGGRARRSRLVGFVWSRNVEGGLTTEQGLMILSWLNSYAENYAWATKAGLWVLYRMEEILALVVVILSNLSILSSILHPSCRPH